MRILHVNKFLYRRGGAEAYMHEVADLQEARGDTVAFFGMAHPDNGPFPYASSFPSEVRFDEPTAGARDRMRAFGRMMYSVSARRGMAEVLDSFRPDVVHLHNIYHGLSPSVLGPIASRDLPAVMTLHDYKLACPTYRFLDHDQICEACLGRRFHQAALHRCKDGSLLASAAGGLELALHTYLQAYAPVRRFLCPSAFLAEKMRQARVYPDRLRVLSNFVDARTVQVKQTPGGPLVYAGRLSSEKGVDLLLHALVDVPDVTLDVAGDGDQRLALERLAGELVPGRVRFHGRLPKSAVLDLLRASVALVLPSRWYENQPMSVLEAYACGVPVVTSRTGAFLELVDEGDTGWLVPPGDVGALAGALRHLTSDPVAALQMGRAGRARLTEGFSPSGHLERLDSYYVEAQGALV